MKLRLILIVALSLPVLLTASDQEDETLFFTSPSRERFDELQQTAFEDEAEIVKTSNYKGLLYAVQLARIAGKHGWPLRTDGELGKMAKEILDGKSVLARYVNDDKQVDVRKLDIWWTGYFATGDMKYLENLLGQTKGDGKDNIPIEDLHTLYATSKDDYIQLCIVDLARWSFSSNCDQHEPVRAYAAKCLEVPEYASLREFLERCAKGKRQEPEIDPTLFPIKTSIGHFTISLPHGWRSAKTPAQLDEKCRRILGDLPFGLVNGQEAEMGDIEFYYNPDIADMYAYSLLIPKQSDFPKATLKAHGGGENDRIMLPRWRVKSKDAKQTNYKGGKLVVQDSLAHSSKIDIDGHDVGCREMVLNNRTRHVTLFYWSPSKPGVVSVLEFFMIPGKTDRELLNRRCFALKRDDAPVDLDYATTPGCGVAELQHVLKAIEINEQPVARKRQKPSVARNRSEIGNTEMSAQKESTAPKTTWPDLRQFSDVSAETIVEMIEQAEDGALDCCLTLCLYYGFADCKEALKWGSVALKQAEAISAGDDWESFSSKEEWDKNLAYHKKDISSLEEMMVRIDLSKEELQADIELAQAGDEEKIGQLYYYFLNVHDFDKARHWNEKAREARLEACPFEEAKVTVNKIYDSFEEYTASLEQTYKLGKEQRQE
ncbi:hypothetical protein PDESU_04608 [Pontiella desulfatans]|uniref:Uncharacterized protein n=1 Tax=Pontiella desulfatans TaxID=2750659 RepID=A0A6C2U7G1_PONDE|nr:hypothetical protein [Pontiella desulfatans]VGO16018.1 hypothetical protein PDESU_04608 [Pontiella desulfatans]